MGTCRIDWILMGRGGWEDILDWHKGKDDVRSRSGIIVDHTLQRPDVSAEWNIGDEREVIW